jgi:hypothetical protein
VKIALTWQLQSEQILESFNIFWNHQNLPLIPLELMQPIKNPENDKKSPIFLSAFICYILSLIQTDYSNSLLSSLIFGDFAAFN